jgi:hypothetical protein
MQTAFAFGALIDQIARPAAEGYVRYSQAFSHRGAQIVMTRIRAAKKSLNLLNKNN